MTQARRVSAVPRDFYFADPKQLTPLQVIGTLGSVTPLPVLFWQEERNSYNNQLFGQDGSSS
jgi:hypothetical protein